MHYVQKPRFNLHQNQIMGDKLHFQSFSFESVHKSHNILDTLSRLRAQLGTVPSVSTKPVLSENTIDKKAAIKLPRPSLALALPRLAPGETLPVPAARTQHHLYYKLEKILCRIRNKSHLL